MYIEKEKPKNFRNFKIKKHFDFFKKEKPKTIFLKKIILKPAGLK
jgi:hypothetical protein